LTKIKEPKIDSFFYNSGSSWTDTLWQVNGTSPSSNNPFGNGVYCSTNQQEYGCNYIDYLVEGKDQSGVYINKTLTLAYNYAHGGATVDNRVVFSSLQPSFYGQVQEFIGNGNVVHNYSDQARWGWNSANSIFVVFMVRLPPFLFPIFSPQKKFQKFENC